MQQPSRQVLRAQARAGTPVKQRFYDPSILFMDPRRPTPNLHHLNVTRVGPHERTYHATKGYRWRRVG